MGKVCSNFHLIYKYISATPDHKRTICLALQYLGPKFQIYILPVEIIHGIYKDDIDYKSVGINPFGVNIEFEKHFV